MDVHAGAISGTPLPSTHTLTPHIHIHTYAHTEEDYYNNFSGYQNKKVLKMWVGNSIS